LFCSSEKSNRSGGKTLAKSRLIPAVPNPGFDLSFEIDTPEGVSKQAALLFEIRATGKELVASRRVTIEEMMQGTDDFLQKLRFSYFLTYFAK